MLSVFLGSYTEVVRKQNRGTGAMFGIENRFQKENSEGIEMDSLTVNSSCELD